MTEILKDEEALLALAEQSAQAYQTAAPFPHAVFDNFMNEPAVQAAVDAFPKPEELDFYRYDNPLEKKLAFDQVGLLPSPISSILYALNSPVFLCFLEKLTGIDGIIPDPYYRGGGIHQIKPGGKLDVHIDFNHYKKLKLERRLNVLLYLNQNWEEEYGGYFELWSGKRENGRHVLNQCEKKILPLFNRLAIFTTSEHSYHGHPEPLNCPEGMTRKSIATYYYTVGRPEDEIADAHSTTFIARPHEVGDEALDALREKRNQSRLTSNVKKDWLA